MAGLYNLTALSQTNSTLDIMQGINTMTNNWFGILFGVALFAIIFIYLSSYNITFAFTSASILTTFLNSYLYYVGMFPLYGLIISICFVFIGMILMVALEK